MTDDKLFEIRGPDAGEFLTWLKSVSPDAFVSLGVRALVRAHAWVERRERTSWGSRVCPG